MYVFQSLDLASLFFFFFFSSSSPSPSSPPFSSFCRGGDAHMRLLCWQVLCMCVYVCGGGAIKGCWTVSPSNPPAPPSLPGLPLSSPSGLKWRFYASRPITDQPTGQPTASRIISVGEKDMDATAAEQNPGHWRGCRILSPQFGLMNLSSEKHTGHYPATSS